MERIGGEVVWEGRHRTASAWTASATTTARRPSARSSSTRARSGSWRTTARRSTWCASRARRWNDAALLELPAGKLDEEGEEPLDTAQRELAEEIGKGARTWQHLTSFYTSPGFTDEECHLFMATDLYDERPRPTRTSASRSWRCRSPELDNVIRDCRDAKTLVGLLWLRAFLNR